MTPAQLYLAIGVPIIGNFLALTIGFGLLSARMTDLRQELVGRLGDLRSEMGTLRTDLQRQIADLQADMTRRFDELKPRVDGLDDRLREVEQRRFR